MGWLRLPGLGAYLDPTKRRCHWHGAVLPAGLKSRCREWPLPSGRVVPATGCCPKLARRQPPFLHPPHLLRLSWRLVLAGVLPVPRGSRTRVFVSWCAGRTSGRWSPPTGRPWKWPRLRTAGGSSCPDAAAPPRAFRPSPVRTGMPGIAPRCRRATAKDGRGVSRRFTGVSRWIRAAHALLSRK